MLTAGVENRVKYEKIARKAVHEAKFQLACRTCDLQLK